MTKIQATKLTKVALNILHPDQAGFMPGRSIFDQVRLNQLMIEYAEQSEQNGMLVSLDQEKAYDKIDHTYMWRVLRKFGIPEKFIKVV
jgi:predicted GNAT family acetyltransferase